MKEDLKYKDYPCFGDWLSKSAVICLTCKRKTECSKAYFAKERRKVVTRRDVLGEKIR